MSKNLTSVMGKFGSSFMNSLEMGLPYSEIKENYADMKRQIKEIVGNMETLSIGELKELGFSKWEEKSEVYLIPLWTFDMIKDGTELTSINGEKAVKGKDKIDLDTRSNCIAWGLEKNEIGSGKK